ncbi:MAG: PAS domain S-box protein [Acidobacteria bacterium]|nr:PAS domain S-box protein [Acidobacteriota bacterium]
MKQRETGEAPAGKPLRVLFIEDRQEDVELSVHGLRRAGFDVCFDVTQNAEEFAACLDRSAYDVVLADYSLPGWAGMEGLEILQKRGLDIPFILVTGIAGEETAVDCIKRGAADYILKDRLVRLPVAVHRALEEKQRRAEQARTHHALRESEERFRHLFEEAPVAYHEIDRQGIMRRVNRAECELLGYARDEILGRPVWAFVAPEQRDLVRETVLRKMLGPYLPVVFEREWMRRDGSRLTVEIHENLILDAQGEITAIRAAVLDVTVREQAEQALRNNEQFLSSVFASIQDGLSVLDAEFNIVRVNPAMEHWFAHALPLVGKKCWQAYHGRSAPCESCPARRTLETGTAAYEVKQRLQAGSQAVRWQEVHSFPLLDPGTGRSSGVIEYIRDITEHRRLEEQFRQAQKREAVGRLAGGIAHDFNNLLMIIRGYSDLLLEELKPADSRRRALEEIRKAGERAAALTRQLLAFSRKQVLQPQILDLNAVVSNINTMLRRLIGEDIELTMLPGAALDRVQADPGQVEQVIMNLAVNARDAMPHGGKLTIETANVNLDEDYARRDGSAAPGPYVRLSVSDTGCGMDAETRAHVFEPFFTTKERDKGTGLGLATVYGIVKQSGGYIWVYSEVGQGTVFKIYLPRAPGSAEVRQQEEVQQTLPGGVETILVAEDDPAVRALVCGALASRGYTVQEARDGREALAAARGYKGPIHLLLTDVVLPHMSGRRLAERLLAERPESRLLYMSGYTDDAVVSHGVSAGKAPFLQKPFSASALSRKVREVLDQPSPRAGRRRKRPR